MHVCMWWCVCIHVWCVGMHECGVCACMGVVCVHAWVWCVCMHGCGVCACMGVVCVHACMCVCAFMCVVCVQSWVWCVGMHVCGVGTFMCGVCRHAWCACGECIQLCSNLVLTDLSADRVAMLLSTMFWTSLYDLSRRIRGLAMIPTSLEGATWW